MKIKRMIVILLFSFMSFILVGCSGPEEDNNTAITGPGTVLASGLSSTSYMAVDSTHIYFTESQVAPNGTVKKVPIAGGSVVTLATGLDNPTDIVTDGQNVYWIESTPFGTIKQLAVAGGTPITLAAYYNEPVSLAIDSNFVYWGDKDIDGSGMIRRIAIGGGSPSDIFNTSITPLNIATDGTDIFFTQPYDSPSGSVLKVPAAGGGSTVLASGLGAPAYIALDSTNVYWLEFGWGQRLGQSSKTGISTIILAEGISSPSTGMLRRLLVADSSNVYVGTTTAINKIPIGGGAITPIVESAVNYFYSLRSIAQDATHIFWADGSSIRKIAK